MALAIVVVAFASLSVRPGPESTGTHSNAVRFTLTLPDETEILDGAQFAVSADGTQVVVSARGSDGQQRLWLRRLQSLEWHQLPRTDGASFPFWSPDSRHIAFFTNRSLKRIDVANELPQTISDVPAGRGGTWSSQDQIVFASVSGLSRVSASGGTPVPVTKVDGAREELAHLWPQFLPDGHHFVFVVQKGNDSRSAIHIGDVNTPETAAIADRRGPTAVVSDLLLFSLGTTLAVQEFDQARGQLIGEARAVGGVEDIASTMTTGSAFSASSTVLVYRRQEEPRHRLMWFDRQGSVVGAVGEPADYDGFAVSPDGRSLAVARRDDQSDASSIWVMDVRSDRVNRLTLGRERDAFPVWSADGARLAFSSRRDNAEGVYAIATNRSFKEEMLFRSPESKRLTDWSRDNRFLIYTARSARSGTDVWALPTMGDLKPEPLEQTPANESQGSLSPDGRWIAYVSDQSGSEEVYVRAFPPSDDRWQISTGGGARPRWRSDGRELYFVSPDGQLLAVDIASAPQPQYRAPRSLFVVRGAIDFDVSPDGRFLVQMPVNESGNRELHVVLNWAAALRR